MLGRSNISQVGILDVSQLNALGAVSFIKIRVATKHKPPGAMVLSAEVIDAHWTEGILIFNLHDCNHARPFQAMGLTLISEPRNGLQIPLSTKGCAKDYSTNFNHNHHTILTLNLSISIS
jgi:hypothetical protein